MFETRGNRKQLNATSSMDPGTLAEFSKFNAVRGGMEGVSLRMERGGGGERERVGLVSLRIKPGDRSH